jgi:hypothetical protein
MGLTKMSPKRDSETERDFRRIQSAAGVSHNLSPFSHPDPRLKFTLATIHPTNSYKKTPAPMASRASVNFSRLDFEAEDDWLPGRGAQREWEREKSDVLIAKEPSGRPRT